MMGTVVHLLTTLIVTGGNGETGFRLTAGTDLTGGVRRAQTRALDGIVVVAPRVGLFAGRYKVSDAITGWEGGIQADLELTPEPVLAPLVAVDAWYAYMAGLGCQLAVGPRVTLRDPLAVVGVRTVIRVAIIGAPAEIPFDLGLSLRVDATPRMWQASLGLTVGMHWLHRFEDDSRTASQTSPPFVPPARAWRSSAAGCPCR